MKGKVIGGKMKPNKEVKQILWLSKTEVKRYKKNFVHDVAIQSCEDFWNNKNYPLEIFKVKK